MVFTTYSTQHASTYCVEFVKGRASNNSQGWSPESFWPSQETAVKVQKVADVYPSRILKTMLQKGQRKNRMNLYKRSSSELRASMDKQIEPQDFGVFEEKLQVIMYILPDKFLEGTVNLRR